jgi:centromere/kinetochore protein ZW10
LGLESSLLSEHDTGVLMDALIKWLETYCLPDHVEVNQLNRITQIQQFLLKSTVPVCKDLVKHKLIPLEPTPRIIAFCQEFEKNYVDHRRCILLNEARDILCQNDYHNTVVVGVDENPSPDNLQEAALSVFKLSKCSISETAHKLIILVRMTMDEAVEITSSVTQDSVLSLLRPTLYRTAREMLSLFRAIIPASHGREVAHVPRTAGVLHNDAVFLAHHCLTLGLEYREKFPPVDEDDARGKLLKQTCIFVDMVPLFRELADTSMGDMMELQKNQLAEIVGSRVTYFGKALRSDESLHEWSEAETALAAGIYHLRHLAQAWKPILSPSVFLRSLGYLADVLFVLYLQQVTSANDISPSACQFTSALFHKATVDISGLLGSAAHEPSKFATEWGHFVAVGKFLELNQLSQVEQALSSGVFRDVASQELGRLITATFADSPHRRALLHSLSSAV